MYKKPIIPSKKSQTVTPVKDAKNTGLHKNTENLVKWHLVQNKLATKDVEWIALDTFRIWSKDVTVDKDGTTFTAIMSKEYHIKELDV